MLYCFTFIGFSTALGDIPFTSYSDVTNSTSEAFEISKETEIQQKIKKFVNESMEANDEVLAETSSKEDLDSLHTNVTENIQKNVQESNSHKCPNFSTNEEGNVHCKKPNKQR